MAGLNMGGAQKSRRSLDSEINMIPMIDLLMVTISFLLITAVWVQSQRMEATAQVPGATTEPPCVDCPEETRLHVEATSLDKFVLTWRQGHTVVRSLDVPRGTKTDFASLAESVNREWNAEGKHREANDRRFDHAIVHVPNDARYRDLVAVMDAVAKPKRRFVEGSKTYEMPAFDVSLAVD